MDKVTRQCTRTKTFSKRKESRSDIEPRSFRLRLTARPNRLTMLCYRQLQIYFVRPCLREAPPADCCCYYAIVFFDKGFMYNDESFEMCGFAFGSSVVHVVLTER